MYRQNSNAQPDYNLTTRQICMPSLVHLGQQHEWKLLMRRQSSTDLHALKGSKCGVLFASHGGQLIVQALSGELIHLRKATEPGGAD